jgi:hypothetical protein
VTASVGLLIYGLSRGQQEGFSSPVAIVSLVSALGLGAAFVFVERRFRAPMIPSRIVSDPRRRLALGVMVLLGAVVAGYVYFTSLYLQNVLHFSALRTGIALIPATATVMVTSVFLLAAYWPELAPALFSSPASSQSVSDSCGCTP